MACSLLNLGSLENTIIASLFHSGLHSGTIFLWKKQCHMLFWGMTGYAIFWQKKDQEFLWCQIDFLIVCNFFVLTIFWSGAKQRICFRESMSVLDQNGRIQALGFLARWRLISHALYYKIPYCYPLRLFMNNHGSQGICCFLHVVIIISGFFNK